MKFMGSKERLSKKILPIILDGREDGQWYVEPFGGGANTIDKVDGNRLYSDVNECLSRCLEELSKGWIPPEEISREFYSECREKFKTGGYSEDEMHLIGYVGVNGSYGGRWFDGGYAGVSTTKLGTQRNYPLEAWRNVMAQAPSLTGCSFTYGDYKDLTIPESSIVYCDPPYSNTKEYITAKKSGFSSEEFWDWCRELVTKGHKVFVSEYAAPSDFSPVWEASVKSSLSANGVVGESKTSVERLFVHRSQQEEVTP